MDPDTTSCLLIGRYEGLDTARGGCALRVSPGRVIAYPEFFDGPFSLLATAPSLRVLHAEIAAVGDDPESTVADLVEQRILLRLVPRQEQLVFKSDLVLLLTAHLYPTSEFAGHVDAVTALIRTAGREPWPVSLATLAVLVGNGAEPIGKVLRRAIQELSLTDEQGYAQFAADLPLMLRNSAAYLGFPDQN